MNRLATVGVQDGAERPPPDVGLDSSIRLEHRSAHQAGIGGAHAVSTTPCQLDPLPGSGPAEPQLEQQGLAASFIPFDAPSPYRRRSTGGFAPGCRSLGDRLLFPDCDVPASNPLPLPSTTAIGAATVSCHAVHSSSVKANPLVLAAWFARRSSMGSQSEGTHRVHQTHAAPATDGGAGLATPTPSRQRSVLRCHPGGAMDPSNCADTGQQSSGAPACGLVAQAQAGSPGGCGHTMPTKIGTPQRGASLLQPPSAQLAAPSLADRPSLPAFG